MPKITLVLPNGEIPVTGKQVTFIAPCNSEDVSGLSVGEFTFNLVDESGRPFSTQAFEQGTMVCIVLDVESLKAYVQNSKKVNKTGDIMEGDLNMNGHKITNLPEPVEDHEPATKGYVDTPTGVEAGTYGKGPYGPGSQYYIPKITVDEQGRLTSVEECILGTVSSSSGDSMSSNTAGLMSSTMYDYSILQGNKDFRTKTVDIDTAVSEYNTIYGYKYMSNIVASDDNYNYYFPMLIGVYALVKVSSSNYKYWVPITDYYTGCYSNGTSGCCPNVSVKLPEKYTEFNQGAQVTFVACWEYRYGAMNAM